MKPSERYAALIASGEISHDSSQANALSSFDRLHTEVVNQIHESDKASWWKKLLKNRNTAPARGIYLYGGVGTGKTLLMDLFYESLPEGVARRIHFHRFMQSVHDQKTEIKDQQRPLEIIAKTLARKHRVLCLDEFAVTDITDAMILYGLLSALFENRVALVTTSNIVQQDLYKDGLQRARFLPAIELLETHTEEINVDSGTDYRMAFLQSGSLYHTPLGQSAVTAMEQSFAHLAGLQEESKHKIDLHGREVNVVATGSGAVWFEFTELCEGNRSKVDYIEISRRFHTVLLANVRVMQEDDNDACRRFIELIDELYDRAVNLIISAETLPDNLYQGTRLSMPFERTISRLQEMASEEYLARPHLP